MIADARVRQPSPVATKKCLKARAMSAAFITWTSFSPTWDASHPASNGSYAEPGDPDAVALAAVTAAAAAAHFDCSAALLSSVGSMPSAAASTAGAAANAVGSALGVCALAGLVAAPAFWRLLLCGTSTYAWSVACSCVSCSHKCKHSVADHAQSAHSAQTPQQCANNRLFFRIRRCMPHGTRGTQSVLFRAGDCGVSCIMCNTKIPDPAAHPVWVGVDVAGLSPIQLSNFSAAVQPAAHHAAAHQPRKQLPKGVTWEVGYWQLQQHASAAAAWLRVPLC
jgi:hypothetical protein